MGEVRIVSSIDFLREELGTINRDAIRSDTPYALVNPAGPLLWLGPLVVPRQTGCWECLAQRLRFNRPIETYLRSRGVEIAQHFDGIREWGSAVGQGVGEIAIAIVTHEVRKWKTTGQSILEGTLVTFDPQTLRARMHRLVRRPQCPACGDEVKRDAETIGLPFVPLRLQSRKKRFTADGGHRTVPPDETLATYAHHVSPLTGVVQHLHRTSDPDNPLVHSYAAVHTNTSIYEGEAILHKNRMVISGGKGRSDLQARVSGLCEGIERTSGIFRGDEPTRWATFEGLGDEAIHPGVCLCISERQYRDRAILNEINERGQVLKLLARWIPEPFDETASIEWSPAWSISEERHKFLPTAYCFYGYPPERSIYCRADSNGCAAGNTIEEAILQGFLELVERDAVAIWWYNRLIMPGVDLDSFGEPYFEQLTAYHASVGRELWALDLTSDLGIPSFVALSRRIAAPREDILLGFGAHFDARLAVQRALTELNQVLPVALRTKNRPDGTPDHPDRLAARWWTEATLENQPYLVPRAGGLRGAADYPPHTDDDILDDVRRCTDIVESRGMELLVLDQTRPDVGMPVVKVVVPGMRHYWPRLGPGRLYDVPVQTGLCSARTPEEALNPFPIFF